MLNHHLQHLYFNQKQKKARKKNKWCYLRQHLQAGHSTPLVKTENLINTFPYLQTPALNSKRSSEDKIKALCAASKYLLKTADKCNNYDSHERRF